MLSYVRKCSDRLNDVQKQKQQITEGMYEIIGDQLALPLDFYINEQFSVKVH